MSSNLAPADDLPSRPPISTRASQILWGPRPDEPDHDFEPDAAEVVDWILFALGVEELTEDARTDVARPIVRLLRDLEDERARRSESERAVAALNALVDDVEARRDAQEREILEWQNACYEAADFAAVAIGAPYPVIDRDERCFMRGRNPNFNPTERLIDLVETSSGITQQHREARERVRKMYMVGALATRVMFGARGVTEQAQAARAALAAYMLGPGEAIARANAQRDRAIEVAQQAIRERDAALAALKETNNV